MSASLSFVFANTELLQSRGTRQIRMFAPSAAMNIQLGWLPVEPGNLGLPGRQRRGVLLITARRPAL